MKEATGDRVLERISLPIVNTPPSSPLDGGEFKEGEAKTSEVPKASPKAFGGMRDNILSPVYMQGNGEKVRSQK
jgi:hypothetical protein